MPNTTENATNPPLPPRLIEDWTPAAHTGPGAVDGWTVGPFAVTRAVDGQSPESFRAWMQLCDYDADAPAIGYWLHLGEHPSTRGAINACRDVAGALQRARRR